MIVSLSSLIHSGEKCLIGGNFCSRQMPFVVPMKNWSKSKFKTSREEKKEKKKKKESIIKLSQTQWQAFDSIWQLNMPRTLQSIGHHLAAPSCETASACDILQGPNSYPYPLQALSCFFPAISPFHRQGTCRLKELSFSLSFMIRLHHPLCGLLPSCALQGITPSGYMGCLNSDISKHSITRVLQINSSNLNDILHLCNFLT